MIGKDQEISANAKKKRVSFFLRKKGENSVRKKKEFLCIIEKLE